MCGVLAFLALLVGMVGTIALYGVAAIYRRGYQAGREAGQAESVRRLVRGAFELELDIDESVTVAHCMGVN